MVTPAGRNAFREFLRTEFSEENMLFWMACEELKKEANKSTIEEKARIIYEDYISILSPKEVCVSSEPLLSRLCLCLLKCCLHSPGLCPSVIGLVGPVSTQSELERGSMWGFDGAYPTPSCAGVGP